MINVVITITITITATIIPISIHISITSAIFIIRTTMIKPLRILHPFHNTRTKRRHRLLTTTTNVLNRRGRRHVLLHRSSGRHTPLIALIPTVPPATGRVPAQVEKGEHRTQPPSSPTVGSYVGGFVCFRVVRVCLGVCLDGSFCTRVIVIVVGRDVFGGGVCCRSVMAE